MKRERLIQEFEELARIDSISFQERQMADCLKGKLKELSTFPENDYTDAGQLLGHIMIGAEWVGDAIKSIDGFPVVLANELKHCILAHHGELEFGSPKKPALVEALALSFADNIDAKMETFRELLVNVPENDTKWQGYNRFMETNFRRTSV